MYNTAKTRYEASTNICRRNSEYPQGGYKFASLGSKGFSNKWNLNLQKLQNKAKKHKTFGFLCSMKNFHNLCLLMKLTESVFLYNDIHIKRQSISAEVIRSSTHKAAKNFTSLDPNGVSNNWWNGSASNHWNLRFLTH